MIKRSPGTMAQCLMLLGLALAATVAARFFYESPLSLKYAWTGQLQRQASEKGMASVSVQEAKVICDAFTHLVLDARKPADYLAGRLPGALSLPASDIDGNLAGILPLLSAEQPVLVYCSGEACDESLKLGEFLVTSGYTNVSLFIGGMTSWESAGYPVER